MSDDGVYCFHADTLVYAWTALRGEHTLEPVIADGRVLVGTSRGLYALDVGTGRALWHNSASGLVFTPTVAAGKAYVSDREGRLAAVDLATGEARWRRTFEGWSYPPAVVGETLITGGQTGIVRGIDRRTGETRWRHDVGAELVYRPIAAGARALVTAFDGSVVALTEDGTPAWRKQDAVASLSPAVSGSRAVFAGIDGTVRTRALDDGRLLWRRAIGADFEQRPHPQGDSVGLIDSDGRVVVLRLADGSSRLSTRVDAKPLGAPIARSDGQWMIPYRRQGGEVAHLELPRPSGTPLPSRTKATHPDTGGFVKVEENPGEGSSSVEHWTPG